MASNKATTPMESFQAARLRASIDRPYLSSALWSLMPQETPGLSTLAVDKWWRVYFDPATVLEWSVEHVAAVLYHEIGHCLREHCIRGEGIGADPKLFNFAGDAEINDDLIAEGVALPGTPITPTTIGMENGLMAEEYYYSLQKKQQEQEAQGQGQQSGKSKGKGKGQQDPGNPLGGNAGCGSCATGIQESWELPGPDNGGPDGMSTAEANLVRQEVARQILEHIKNRGTMPGGWKRWAEKYGKVHVDLRALFLAKIRRAIADTSGMSDYTRQRISRRQSAFPDFPIHALRKPKPIIALVIDTSGSMSDEYLGKCLAWVDGCLTALGMRETVHVISADAAAHTTQRIFSTKQIDLIGGGGTDMMVGIRKAAELKPRPHVTIVLTDGETPWDAEPVRGAGTVVIGLVGSGSDYYKTPAWARVLRIDKESVELGRAGKAA